MKYQNVITLLTALLLASSSGAVIGMQPTTAALAANHQKIGVLSRQIKANILQDAAQRSHTRGHLWKITKVQFMSWVPFYGGNGPSQPMTGIIPIAQPVSGWRVVVRGPRQTWVYYVTKEGFELDAPKSVPQVLVNEAISQATRSSGKPAANFKLHWAELQHWQNTCLEIVINQQVCPKSPKSIPGWRIQVISRDGQPQIWTFHSRLTNDVRLQGARTWQPPQ